MDTPGIRLAIVDDRQMVLTAPRAWLGQAEAEISEVIAVLSWAELISHPAFPVDVVLLDIDREDGIAAPVKISILRRADVAVIVISDFPDPARIKVCLGAGAASYLPKSEPAEEILRAVSAAASGQAYTNPSLLALLVEGMKGRIEATPALSPQELHALTLYASGLPLKTVARRLNVTINTAKQYIYRVRRKYDAVGRMAPTKAELCLRAVEDGWLGGK